MGNKFASDLISKIDERFSVDSLNMSYTDWVCKNTTIKKRPFSLKGYEFQRAILDDMHPNLSCIKISQVGLALALNTPINTPTGWKTMEDLQVGDKVYDEKGKICNVTYTSPIYMNRECYEVIFDDNSKIVADADHKWFVKSERLFHPVSGKCKNKGRVPTNVKGYVREGILTTQQLYNDYKGKGGRNHFYIPVTEPIQSNKLKLPLDPYYLGLWLGDGHSYSTGISSHSDDAKEIIQNLQDRGFIVTKTLKDTVYTIKPQREVYSKLNKLKLLNNKHIPLKYLKSSIKDRFELLRGLLDSDGSITGGRVSFHNTNETLIANVEELLASLGFKYHTRWRKPSKAANYKGKLIISRLPIAEVSFVSYSDVPVFNLNRKKTKLLDRSKGRPTECQRRRIKKIIRVGSTPVKCIQVDSPSHLYLAGLSMIPTHNTEVQIRKALAFLVRNQGTSCIFSLPNDDMYKRVSNSRVKPIIDNDRVFNTPYDKANRVTRSVDMKQFGQSFMYLVAAIESAATSISADMVLNDEIDLSDQQMIALFNSRLQGSKYRISQRFSTPTFPAYGIDLDWKVSDQMHYMVKCKCCGNWTYPEFNRKFVHLPGMPEDCDLHEITIDFKDQLDFSNAYIKCDKCHKPLDLDDPAVREWVPMYPSRVNNRGYSINPFVTSNLDLFYIFDSLWRYTKNENLRGFFNTVLGKPYSDGSTQLAEDAIKNCFGNITQPPNLKDYHDGIIVGIDVGQVCHIVIGDSRTNDPISFYTVHVDNLVSHIEELCKNYTVHCGAIDRHPYEPTADEVFRVSGGKIIPTEYRGLKDVNVVTDPYGEVTHAQVNRTWLIDLVANRIRKGSITFNGYGILKETITTHLRNMVREESPEEPATWKKLLPDDHFFHALAFMNGSKDICELTRLKSNAETRTLVLGHVVSTKSGSSNLIGVSTKSLDKIGFKG